MSNKPSHQDPLRAKAEALLDHLPPAKLMPRPEEALLHELRVHQIELEMQNETLRQSQIALEESRDRYVDLYDLAPVGYLTLNRNGLIDEINLTGAALLGVERNRLIHQRFVSLVASEDREAWHRYFMGAIQHGEQRNCELALKRTDDMITHIRLDCRRTKIGNEFLIHLAFADISEHKRAERILRQSLEQLKGFIRQAPICIAMLDLDMNYLAVSNRWLTEYGRGYTDLVGRNDYEVNPDLPAEWKAVHQQALAGASLENPEDVWIQRDGSKHWLRWAVRPWMDENGKIGGIIISVEDITDKKALEVEIAERRQEMGHLQRQHVAAQTAAAIAHEINQPLLAIASYSEAALMMMKSGKPDYDEVCDALEKSEQQALRAGRSIRDLIAYLSKNEFPAEAFDFNQEIRDSLGAARSEHNLAFRSILDLEEGLPLVRANRTHVQKVLLNLIHNGIDAMKDAGVPLPAITVTVRTTKCQNYAQMTIQDNGPGVRKEGINRLFEPFFTTKTRGIGMGLAISRSLIEENGGQLWVDPQEGQGATFHLTLPFAK